MKALVRYLIATLLLAVSAASGSGTSQLRLTESEARLLLETEIDLSQTVCIATIDTISGSVIDDKGWIWDVYDGTVTRSFKGSTGGAVQFVRNTGDRQNGRGFTRRSVIELGQTYLILLTGSCVVDTYPMLISDPTPAGSYVGLVPPLSPIETSAFADTVALIVSMTDPAWIADRSDAAITATIQSKRSPAIGAATLSGDTLTVVPDSAVFVREGIPEIDAGVPMTVLVRPMERGQRGAPPPFNVGEQVLILLDHTEGGWSVYPSPYSRWILDRGVARATAAGASCYEEYVLEERSWSSLAASLR